MSGQFTPGPWAVSSVSMNTGAIGIAKERILIAEVHNGYSFMDVVQGNHPSEQWANARLVEAAPDLIAALQYARNLIGPDEIVDAAIAKATGAA